MKSRKIIHYAIFILCIYSILYVFGQFFFLRTGPDDIRISLHSNLSPDNKNISIINIQTQWIKKPEFYTRENLIIVYFNKNEKWSIVNKNWYSSTATLFSKTLFDPSIQPNTIIPFDKYSNKSITIKAMRNTNFYESNIEQDTFHIMIVHEIKIPFLPPYYWIKDAIINIQDTQNENLIF